MKKTHYLPLLLLSFIFGCSDANIDLVKESRLTADENYTIEQAFDNRKLCEGIEWISTTDDVGRDIVEYHCNLIKPIAAINDAELKKVENLKKSIARELEIIDFYYKEETQKIEEEKIRLEKAKNNLDKKRPGLEETLSKLENELGKETIESSRDITWNEMSIELTDHLIRLRELKNGTGPIEWDIPIPKLKQRADKLQKILTYFKTESELSGLRESVERRESDLEYAEKREASTRFKKELEETKKKIENPDITDFISIHEVFKFLVIDEETINVIEAGLVFEIDEDGEEKTIYKKYSDRQLYLHIEDVYKPNGFSSTIRLRHYNSFLK